MSRSLPTYPEDLQKWEKLRNEAISTVMENDKSSFKRKPIDTWAFIDEMGLTLEEFRLLYLIGSNERWLKGSGGVRKKYANGCYMKRDNIAKRAGMSPAKVTETLKILVGANIIEALGRKRRVKGGETLAAAPNEYRIAPFHQWLNPPELKQKREEIQNKSRKT